MFDTADLRTCHNRRINESERESITRRNTTVARAADFIDANCKWFGIESAPRDGTSVIILCQDMEIEASYCQEEQSWDHDGNYTGDGAVWSAFDGALQFEVEELRNPEGRVWYEDGSVTHWKPKMTLPPRRTLS